MIPAFDNRVGDRIVLAPFIPEDSEQIARGKQADGTAGDIFLRDHAEFIGMHDMLIGAAAVQIAAGF